MYIIQFNRSILFSTTTLHMLHDYSRSANDSEIQYANWLAWYKRITFYMIPKQWRSREKVVNAVAGTPRRLQTRNASSNCRCVFDQLL